MRKSAYHRSGDVTDSISGANQHMLVGLKKLTSFYRSRYKQVMLELSHKFRLLGVMFTSESELSNFLIEYISEIETNSEIF